MTRRALVLGAGGFLGSHLSRRLVRDGWDVTAVARRPADRIVDIVGDLRLVTGDATDRALLDRLVPAMDAVFPLAGRSGATRSMDEPLADAAANAMGQLVVLEALRHHNRDARVVFPGSRLQYGRPMVFPVREDHPQQPTSVYALHKMLGEQYHLLYAERHGIATCCLRISNPYGPAQDRPDQAFGVVGTFLARAAAGEDVAVFGGGRQRRDYVYVDDLVDLLLLAVTHPAAPGEVFNAGGPTVTTVREMAEAVVRVVGRGRVVDVPWPDAEAAVETGDYFGDLRRSRDVLGWVPQIELDEGLAATWATLTPALT